MEPYIYYFSEIDEAKLSLVGGKGINLAKLSKIDGLNVPDGFCISTNAYRKAIENVPELDCFLERLNALDATDREQIAEISQSIRRLIENIALPLAVEKAIKQAISTLGIEQAFAIRSSATAEDLPHASFAGQQDTFLNISGEEQVLRHVSKCWASLFTDRAVTYRIQHGFDQRKVFLSVIVQKMVDSEASGVMFTADPMSSDRTTLTIDASIGLGEALVSGLVNPDHYQVRNGVIVEKKLSDGKSILSDNQIMQLVEIGKKIEAHFGSPQDIEWCLRNNQFYVVQSRPITTLFPLPDTKGKRTPRVYMSIGHTQMMTDAIKPLGMSFFQMISDVSLQPIGGRLFADITHDLSSTVGRTRLVSATGQQDPFIQAAIKKLLGDKTFLDSLPRGERNIKGGIFTAASLKEAIKMFRKNDPAVMEEILARFEKELSELDEQLSALTGVEALECIHRDREALLAMAYHPTILGAIIAAILANDWLNKQIEKWLGEQNVDDTLSKSLDHNITTEMGLALCDVADTIRSYPEIIEYLTGSPKDENFFLEMEKLTGGKEVKAAFEQFFEKFGMRCPGEIDITKERFAEKPTQLLPVLLNNIRILEPGEHIERFLEGEWKAKEKQESIIHRLQELPGGERKAKKTLKRISVLRHFSGYREEPKYYIMRRFQIYKKALLWEAKRLVDKGVFNRCEDIFYLFFDELLQVVKDNEVDYALIEQRKKEHVRYEKLTPPRVLTSDGYVPSVSLSSKDIPEGALIGIPVSAGVVEGRARVVLSVEEAELEKGDILVTQFTDPSWTPLFVTIEGLVTEVGGFTTHGAVITREYGLPGVVGVENATKMIKDGQKIRVDGTKGYVEIL